MNKIYKVAFILSLASCGGDSDNEPNTANQITDLNGDWQSNCVTSYTGDGNLASAFKDFYEIDGDEYTLTITGYDDADCVTPVREDVTFGEISIVGPLSTTDGITATRISVTSRYEGMPDTIDPPVYDEVFVIKTGLLYFGTVQNQTGSISYGIEYTKII